MHDNSQPTYRFGEVEVDLQRQTLRVAGQEHYLRPKTFSVLVYLIEQRQRLVTKDELINQVWDGAVASDDTLVQSIVDIRKALGDDSRQPRFVKTLPKLGYHFISPVEEVRQNGAVEFEEITSVQVEFEEEEHVSPIAAPALPAPSQAVSRQQVLIISFALLTVMALGGWFALRGRKPEAEVKLPQVPGKKALAVLFFENRSGTPELDWLREGLADMLIANFSRAPKLSVLSRQQLAVLLDRLGHGRGAQLPLEEALELARKAQAEVIALGSFAQLGEKVRLDVQLHDARTGRLLVTESSIADSPAQVLSQVDLLSLKLASHLGATPPALNAQQSLSTLMTNNLDAYRYYSLALEQTQMFQFAEAIALLEKAIALDPQFALAYGRIGYVYAVKWNESEKAKPYLAKAIALADRLSEKDKLFVTAWSAIANNDSVRAIEVYREIIARHPLEVEVYERLGLALYRQARWEEALPLVRQGLVIDPNGKELHNILGYLCLYLGRYDEGLTALRHYVELAPNDPNAYDGLGSFHQWFGEYEQAAAAYQRALALNPELHNAVIHLGNLYVRQGRYAAALEQFRRYVQVARTDAQRARGHDYQAWVWLRKGELVQVEAANAQQQKYAKQPKWNSVELALRRGDQGTAAHLAEPHIALTQYEHLKERGFLRLYYYQRGSFALQSGRTDEAVEHFREAMRHPALEWHIDPYEDCLANGYFAAGRFDEAIAEYGRLLRLNPRYPLGHYHLGQVYERKGDGARARTAYETFLQIWQEADADIPEVIEAKQRLGRL